MDFDNQDVLLMFGNDSDEPDEVVIEHGVFRGTGEFLRQVGEVIALRSGMPFPEAVITTADGTPPLYVALPTPGNGASNRNDNARAVLETAATMLLTAAAIPEVTVAVVTEEGPRTFTAKTVAPTSRSTDELQNEQTGPDTDSCEPDGQLKETF